MSKPTFKEIRDEAESIYQTYDARFAGKSRATRNVELLDELIEKLQGLIENGRTLQNGTRDPALISVLEMATDNLEIYKKERAAILEAKESGPAIAEVSAIIVDANLAFSAYHRHFAGKDRRTRDLGLIDELISDLEVIEKRFEEQKENDPDNVATNLNIVQENLRLYRNEREQIVLARRSGTQSERGDGLAAIANGQFKIYRELFAGKSRTSRRPELLERMIAQLVQVQREMQELVNGGYRIESHRRNLDIVRQNLEMYRGELKEIKKVRGELSAEQLAGNLGAAANQTMEQYREHFAGQDRRTRDLELLSALCDQMGELKRQMSAIAATESLEMNDRNLEIVTDTVVMYENEYRQVEQAQAG